MVLLDDIVKSDDDEHNGTDDESGAPIFIWKARLWSAFRLTMFAKLMETGTQYNL